MWEEDYVRDDGYFGEEASFMHALRSDILVQEQLDLEEARLIQDDHEEAEDSVNFGAAPSPLVHLWNRRGQARRKELHKHCIHMCASTHMDACMQPHAA